MSDTWRQNRKFCINRSIQQHQPSMGTNQLWLKINQILYSILDARSISGANFRRNPPKIITKLVRLGSSTDGFLVEMVLTVNSFPQTLPLSTRLTPSQSLWFNQRVVLLFAVQNSQLQEYLYRAFTKSGSGKHFVFYSPFPVFEHQNWHSGVWLQVIFSY